MWILYTLISAVFAAIVAILVKIGIEGVDSNLATAIRTVVILFLSWGIVFFTVPLESVKSLSMRNWTFLVLSGLATGLSWLFYFKALQEGDASKVGPLDKMSVVFTIIFAFIFLREPLTWQVLLGGVLIFSGSCVVLCGKSG